LARVELAEIGMAGRDILDQISGAFADGTNRLSSFEL